MANANAVTKPTNYSQLNGKSIEKYLMKQNYARNLKNEAELHAQKVFSAGRNWTPNVTRPKMPNITDAQRLSNNEAANQTPQRAGKPLTHLKQTGRHEPTSDRQRDHSNQAPASSSQRGFKTTASLPKVLLSNNNRTNNLDGTVPGSQNQCQNA